MFAIAKRLALAAVVIAACTHAQTTQQQTQSDAGTVAPASSGSSASTTSKVPNWVSFNNPTDSACYRKTYLTKECPAGYNYDNIATCWAQCPINYPVECGMECIPQSDDCATEILTKIESVAKVAINAATSGIFGQISTASKAVQTGVQCVTQLYSIGNKLLTYAKELKADYPDTTEEQLIFLLNNTDFAVYDLPVAVTTCLGLPTPAGLEQAAEVVDVIAKILEEAISDSDAFSSVEGFIEFITSLNLSDLLTSEGSVSTSDISTYVTSTYEADTACGEDLQTLVNKIVAMVQEIKSADSSSAVDVIREVVTNSEVS